MYVYIYIHIHTPLSLTLEEQQGTAHAASDYDIKCPGLRICRGIWELKLAGLRVKRFRAYDRIGISQSFRIFGVLLLGAIDGFCAHCLGFS